MRVRRISLRYVLVALKRAGWVGRYRRVHSLLGAGVLGDSLGTFRDSVLGKLTREEKPDSSLDFPGGDGGPLVVVSKTASFSGDTLKDVVHERVHDRHGL